MDLRRCRIFSADRGICSPMLVVASGRGLPGPYAAHGRVRVGSCGAGSSTQANHQYRRVDFSVGATEILHRQ